MTAPVVVEASLDNLRSDDVRFLEEAAAHGPLHVRVPSDALVAEHTGAPPALPGGGAAVPRRVHPLGGSSAEIVDRVARRAPPTSSLPSRRPDPRSWSARRTTHRPAGRGRGRWRRLRHREPRGPRRVPDRRSRPAAPGGHAAGRGHRLLRLAPLGSHPVLHGRRRVRRAVRGRRQRPERRAAQRRRATRCSTRRSDATWWAPSGASTACLVSSGEGWMDAEPEIDAIQPTFYVVNEDGDQPEKRAFCRDHGIEYVVLAAPAPCRPARPVAAPSCAGSRTGRPMLPFRTRPDLRPRVWGGSRLTPTGARARRGGVARRTGVASRRTDPMPGRRSTSWPPGTGRRSSAGTPAGRTGSRSWSRCWTRANGCPSRSTRTTRRPSDSRVRARWARPRAGTSSTPRPTPRSCWASGRGPPRRPSTTGSGPGAWPPCWSAVRCRAGEAYMVPAGTLHAVGPRLAAVRDPAAVRHHLSLRRLGSPSRRPGAPCTWSSRSRCVQAGPWTAPPVTIGRRVARRPARVASTSSSSASSPVPGRRVDCDPRGATVHVLTAVDGTRDRRAGTAGRRPSSALETLVVPADAGAYTIEAVASDPVDGSAAVTVLLARVPTSGERSGAGGLDRGARTIGHVDPP